MNKDFEDFKKLWGERDSPHEIDQTNLYYSIIKIARNASNLKSFSAEEQDILINDFYVDKILTAMQLGYAISRTSYNDINPPFIVLMMNQYVASFIRNEEKKVPLAGASSPSKETTKAINISLDDMENNSDQYSCNKEIYKGNIEKLSHQSDTENYETDRLIKNAIDFLESSEGWITLLITNQCSDLPLNRLAAHYEIKSAHSKAAKLGLLHKGSHYQGTKSLEDYHHTTIIGRWIRKSYGDEAIPLTPDFLQIILKSLCDAAFILRRNDWTGSRESGRKGN